jgi:hypothetical protein
MKRHEFFIQGLEHHLKLSVPANHQINALEALIQIEPWLVELENTLGHGVLPEPINEKNGASLHSWPIQWIGANDQHMHLTWAHWQALSNHLSPCFSEGTFQPLACHLIFDTLPFSDVDLATIEPHALVLQPSSFVSPWSVHVQLAADLKVVWQAHLEERSNQWSIQLVSQAAMPLPNAPPHPISKLRKPLMLNLDDLVLQPNTSNTAPLVLALPLFDGQSAIAIERLDTGTALAYGHLIPAACGFAVRIDEVPVWI